MDNQTQKTSVTADTAEAEEVTAAAGLGKFKDVKALMEAYANLEAEFTRRSQRLKELENANKEKEAPASAQAASAETPSHGQEVYDKETLIRAALNDQEVKNAVIGEYLENAAKNKGVPFISGGVNVSAQRRTPKTVSEAGRLAQEFLNKREN